MLAFGPVPSRRLGLSLGVNNIPPKTCTYSCVYCQLGASKTVAAVPAGFYDVDQIYDAVAAKLDKVQKTGGGVDYVTFVSSGEPTLDRNLGTEIRQLKALGIRIAVITNASLLWRSEVRSALAAADWVSVKVDTVDPRLWRRINRPHKALELEVILAGILKFANGFEGVLATETMLVRRVNDRVEPLQHVAEFLQKVGPSTAYLSIPTRPPAESWAKAPDEGALNLAYQTLQTELARVEYLIGYEGNAFAFTGNLEEDLLNITAVHPMKEAAVEAYLQKAGAEWADVQEMTAKGRLVMLEHGGEKFFMRNLGLRRGSKPKDAPKEK
jgi:wyosine [tRNA(Phe)-imidazoG37] synthetase (radical SAM superfamily)